MPNAFENSMIKMYVSPGSNTEMHFKLKLGRLELNSKSRIIMIFPYYYTPQLSRDGVVRCFMGEDTSEEVNCQITKERVLEVRHFKEVVPTATEIILVVSGVTQPYSLKSSNFFLAFDDDYDDKSFLEFGEIIDTQLTQDLAKSLTTYF
jgi:hypothetical protein